MILKDNNEMKHIFNLFRNVEPHCINSYITEKESILGINWVIDKYVSQEHEVSEPIYIPYKEILIYKQNVQ